ncbi:hypothetical protein BDQ17DRAFT_1547714 [Cyathus striatus]|nr:hypothetical protein BDQ17DRAFT_1547714 [Cyathus striatus]
MSPESFLLQIHCLYLQERWILVLLAMATSRSKYAPTNSSTAPPTVNSGCPTVDRPPKRTNKAANLNSSTAPPTANSGCGMERPTKRPRTEKKVSDARARLGLQNSNTPSAPPIPDTASETFWSIIGNICEDSLFRAAAEMLEPFISEQKVKDFDPFDAVDDWGYL